MSARRMHGEEGASLIIALAFLLLFGLLIPAIVSLGGNNLLGTVRLQGQRADVYAADGALDGAIQYLRQPANASCGRPFAAACTFTTTLNGKTATVTMTAAGGVFDLDRTVNLTAEIPAGTPKATATVIVRDSNTGNYPPGSACTTAPCVDVKLWQYLRP